MKRMLQLFRVVVKFDSTNRLFNFFVVFLCACLLGMVEPAMVIYRLSLDMSARDSTFTFDFSLTIAKCVLPCYADRLTSVCVVLVY